MKLTNKNKIQKFLVKNFKFSIYEIALSGILVGLWIVSALPVFNFNFGFMHMGITYVWPILLGLTTKPFMAIICSILGDNLALLSSGTGFGQWMIEYAVISPAITIIAMFFKKLITSKNNISWWIMVALSNVTILLGTLVTMIVEHAFKFSSKNPSDRVFDFTDQAAKIAVWTIYGLMAVVSLIMICLYLLSFKKAKIEFKGKTLHLNNGLLKQIISFYSLSMIIIIVTIWIWGPFAQIRYLNRYAGTNHLYSEYDLFLIPRILKTPISLTIYTAIILPIYKTNELAVKRIGFENKW